MSKKSVCFDAGIKAVILCNNTLRFWHVGFIICDVTIINTFFHLFPTLFQAHLNETPWDPIGNSDMLCPSYHTACDFLAKGVVQSRTQIYLETLWLVGIKKYTHSDQVLPLGKKSNLKRRSFGSIDDKLWYICRLCFNESLHESIQTSKTFYAT